MFSFIFFFTFNSKCGRRSWAEDFFLFFFWHQALFPSTFLSLQAACISAFRIPERTLKVLWMSFCPSVDHRYSKIGQNTWDTAANSLFQYLHLTLTTNGKDYALTDEWPCVHVQWMRQTCVELSSHTLSAGMMSLWIPALSRNFPNEKEKTLPVVSSAGLTPLTSPLRAPSWQSVGLPGSRLGVDGDGVVAPQMYNVSPSGQGGRPLVR